MSGAILSRQMWETTNLNPSHTSYTDSVMGTWNFSYDSVDRLVSSQNTATTPTSSQYAGNYGCWSYDSFGNRLSQAISTTPCANNPPRTSWANYNANNQFTATYQAPGGVPYDASGDVLNDGQNQYLYDGEGRICAVLSSPMPNVTTMTGYLYDAGGTRVAKGSITTMSCDPAVNGFQTTSDYVLGPGGEQVTEMTVSGSTSTWQHTNVWAGGALIATYANDGLHFYLNDPLGTRRAQTDYAGVLEQTCQSLPFGDALSCSGGSLQAPTEHHFTGKERDTESGNDYFGARYYASSMGRFMSPDWSAKIEPVPYAKLGDPQSLNLYSYVWNNPLSRNDPDGHEVDLTNKDAKLRAETEKRILSNVNKNERGLFTTVTKNGKTELVLNKDAAANFDGKHSKGFNMLNQAINSKSIASVEINDHPTMPDGHVINTGPDAGGGRTVGTGQNGNVNIYLSTKGDESGVALYGTSHQVIPNPVGIIAGHELLGHGRLKMLGRPWGESEAVGVENQLRHEQGLPERAGGYN